MSDKKCERTSVVDPAEFAKRLNYLFDVLHPPGQDRAYRNTEVVRTLSRMGYAVSLPYLSQLRSGSRNGPSPHVVKVLSEFFGIGSEYLNCVDTEYTDQLRAELGWLQLARDPDVREVTMALLPLPVDVSEALLDKAIASSARRRRTGAKRSATCRSRGGADLCSRTQ